MLKTNLEHISNLKLDSEVGKNQKLRALVICYVKANKCLEFSLPAQDFSDSKISQSHWTISWQKDVLQRIPEHLISQIWTRLQSHVHACKVHVQFDINGRNNVWFSNLIKLLLHFTKWYAKQAKGNVIWLLCTCDLMSLCKIFRSWMCFIARQIWTNQSITFKQNYSSDQ